MKTTQSRITLVCPCYNEEAVIGCFYRELKRVLDEDLADVDYRIVFVDDGSVDGTLACLDDLARRDRRVRVYSLSRNFGHQAALSAGLDVARGDAVILMDSDLQHPPSLLPEMIRKWREGYQVVAAVREHTRGASRFKNWTSEGFYRLFNLLSDVSLTPGVADFTLLARPAYRALRSMPERHRFLRGLIAWMGFRRACVPYIAAPRAAGESKYTARRMIAMALDALCSFTARPIQLFTRLGLAALVVGFAYLVYILIHALVLGDATTGWSSMICTLLLLGGLQLSSIGLLGQYVARIFEEVKGRPQYLFKQTPPRRSTGERARLAA